METFNDGIMELWTYGDDNSPIKIANLRFCSKTIGFERHFAAQNVNTEISKLISCPLLISTSIHDFAVINQIKYEIIEIQPIESTHPKTMLLSLRQLEVFEGE